MNSNPAIPAPSRGLSPFVAKPEGLPAIPVEYGEAGGEEKKFELQGMLHALLRWRWLIAGVLLAACIVAIAITLLTTPLYRAKVTLEINNEPVNVVDVGNVQPTGAGTDNRYFDTQIGLLQSDSLAERVRDQLGLGTNAKFTAALAPSRRPAAAVKELRRSFMVVPEKNSRLVDLFYVSPDPKLAADVANSFAENFITTNLERRYAATAYARDFLQKQLELIRGKLETSERQLVDYARQQGIVNIPSGTGGPGAGEVSMSATSLAAMSQALSAAQSDRIAAEQKYRESGGKSSNADVLGNPTVQALQTQKATLEADYQDKLELYKPDHPTMVRLHERIQAINRSLSQVTRSVSDSLEINYRSALARENALAAKVGELKSTVLDVRTRSIQYTILQREVDTNRTLYDGLLQRYKEVGVAGGVGDNLIAIVDRAKQPELPYIPNIFFNLGIAIVAGLILGMGSALALEYIKDTIRTPDDVIKKLNLSLLGIIPAFGKKESLPMLLRDQRSNLSESYASARSAIQFSTSNGPPRSILITSTTPSEGKSSSALALARSFAFLRQRTLIIDGDLRNPSLQGDTKRKRGFAHLLTGSAQADECIEPTSIEGLFLIQCGMVPPNPTELLGSPRARSVITFLESQFDIVIIDGPPILGLADAPLLSSICEGTIMIVQAEHARRSTIRAALRRLHAAKGNVIGSILTKFKSGFGSYSYGYGYGYGYGYDYGYGGEMQMNAGKLNLLTMDD